MTDVRCRVPIKLWSVDGGLWAKTDGRPETGDRSEQGQLFHHLETPLTSEYFI